MDVYIKPGCPWCVQVEAYLQKEGFEYNAIDVIADDEAFARMQELFGQTSAPSMTCSLVRIKPSVLTITPEPRLGLKSSGFGI